MTILELNEEKTAAPPKAFWRRQFQTESTKSQKIFDWFFGVILPVACFVFDPTVFKGDAVGVSYLGNIKPFAYVLSFVSVMAMAAWLIWGAKLKWLSAPLAGLFAVGSAVSLGIAVVLLPISLFGLIIVIGILGFTPFFTSIVFFRNALRAFKAARFFLERKVLIYSLVVSALFGAVVPYVFNKNVEHALAEIKSGDVPTMRANARSLKYVAPLVNFDSLKREYFFKNKETERAEKAALAEIYLELTGENITNESGFSLD